MLACVPMTHEDAVSVALFSASEGVVQAEDFWFARHGCLTSTVNRCLAKESGVSGDASRQTPGFRRHERHGWHSCRRAFANRLRHASLRDLKDLGGWKSEQTVVAVYQQPSESAQRTALLALDRNPAETPTAHGTGTRRRCHKIKSPQRRNLLRGLGFEVGLGGVEPPTSRLSGVRSNHLSYRPLRAFLQSLEKLTRRPRLGQSTSTHLLRARKPAHRVERLATPASRTPARPAPEPCRARRHPPPIRTHRHLQRASSAFSR